MATDRILVDGDMALFMPAFGQAIVVVKPGQIKGSGPALIKGKKMCIAGDEASVKVERLQYMAAPFMDPGEGTITIQKLVDHTAGKCLHGGKAILLKGGDFIAQFEVTKPAKLPALPKTPDVVGKIYVGKGCFIASNIPHKAT